MTWYKVLDKYAKAKDGGSFDYTEYLPNGKLAGQLVPAIPKDKLKECSWGYHVTKYWNMFLSDSSNIILEVEPVDLIENDIAGVNEKAVCGSFKIIKQHTFTFDTNSNTGDNNTGNWNTGYSNTGYRNTGNRNTGYSNTGYSNTGYSNTGDNNTGYSNTGDWNTGYRNTGNRNTGYSNTGYSNTGDNNTGDNNTGYSNTGDSNTGNWNTANKHVGSFNTVAPKECYLFNKKISMKVYNGIQFPSYFYFELKTDYKKSWQDSFNATTKKQVEQTIKLPNFSYKVFEEITGITKKMIEVKLK